MRVLSYEDLTIDHPGDAVSLAHPVREEAAAVVGSVANTGTLGAFDLTGSSTKGALAQ